jgi:hypothetical protein
MFHNLPLSELKPVLASLAYGNGMEQFHFPLWWAMLARKG